MLALWLTRLGIRVRIIDKTSEPGTTSRALGGTSVKGQELCRDLKLLSWWPESNTPPAS